MTRTRLKIHKCARCRHRLGRSPDHQICSKCEKEISSQSRLGNWRYVEAKVEMLEMSAGMGPDPNLTLRRMQQSRATIFRPMTSLGTRSAQRSYWSIHFGDNSHAIRIR